MTPPREFVSALGNFDSSLRIRWAVRTGKWFIERRLPERHKQLLSERPNPRKSELGWDLYDGWREGYIHVLTVPNDLLTHEVFDELANADAWRQGGIEQINQKLDALDEQWERTTDRAIDNWSEAAGKEAGDRMAWLTGRRISTYIPRPERVEQRDGYVVKDRRITARG